MVLARVSGAGDPWGGAPRAVHPGSVRGGLCAGELRNSDPSRAGQPYHLGKYDLHDGPSRSQEGQATPDHRGDIVRRDVDGGLLAVADDGHLGCRRRFRLRSSSGRATVRPRGETEQPARDGRAGIRMRNFPSSLVWAWKRSLHGIKSRRFVLLSIVFPLGLRTIPELLAGPWPLGFDTVWVDRKSV